MILFEGDWEADGTHAVGMTHPLVAEQQPMALAELSLKHLFSPKAPVHTNGTPTKCQQVSRLGRKTWMKMPRTFGRATVDEATCLVVGPVIAPQGPGMVDRRCCERRTGFGQHVGCNERLVCTDSGRNQSGADSRDKK